MMLGTLPKPDLDGYEFIGWFTEREGGEFITEEIIVPNDITYYAHWIVSPYVFSGDAAWTVQTDESWKSGTIEDSETSCMEMVLTNGCKISFSWKCSCEPLAKGLPYDYLSFEIDGVRQDFICGETDWQTKSYEVPGDGEHVFRWIYQKDEEGSEGEDCGWVKQVVVAPRMTLSFDGGDATEGVPPAAMSFYADDESVVLPGCGTLAWPKHHFVGWTDGESTYLEGAEYPVYGSANSLVAVWEENEPETYGEYLNCPGRTFTTGGDAEWVRVKDVSDDGYALQSGTITHSQTSRLETVVYGAGTVSFRCKVDGEIFKKLVFDGLAFCIDGVQQGDLMGENAWTEKSFTVTGDGRHTLSWLYVKDEEGSGEGEDCAWLDNVEWTADDPLPALDVAATDSDAEAIIAGLSDVRLSGEITNTTAYAAFRSWVDGKNLSHALVKDAPNAWLSYVLDAPGLMAKEALTSEDVVIESIEPSGTAAGAFELVVDIGEAEIGTAARLAEALGVEGSAELNESAFSSEGLTVTLQRTADGKTKATVTPEGAPTSFFLRVKVK